MFGNLKIESIEQVQCDSAEDIEVLEKLAYEGDLHAQTQLGYLYYDGIKLKQDYEKAYKWVKLAADQGEPIAQFMLGALYHEGNGVEQDDTEAYKWVKLAADQGEPIAQSILGVLYHEGLGVEQDDTEAYKWIKLATDQGNPRAQFMLGVLYHGGLGVEQDDTEAYKWVKLAADQGNPDAQTVLGGIYYDGIEAKQDYAEARKWYKLAADQGNPRAQFMLGVLYYQGNGVKQDYVEAHKWYKLAADQGESDAQAMLSVLYHEGLGVRQDYAEARKWYKLVADQGEPNAQAMLGDLYYEGNGVKQDYVKAYKWYKLAADQGEPNAQAMLGDLYHKGLGVEQDDSKAIREQMSSIKNDILKWNLAFDGRELGEFTTEEIDYQIDQNSFEVSSLLVWRKGMEKWEVIEKVPEFEHIVEKYLSHLPPPLPNVVPNQKRDADKQNWNKSELSKFEIEDFYVSLSSYIQKNFYLRGDNSQKAKKKFNNALNSYAKLENYEEAFILFDNTIFGSAKEGFLITNKNIYWHNPLSFSKKIAIKDIKTLELKKNILMINNKEIGMELIDKKNISEFIQKFRLMFTHK